MELMRKVTPSRVVLAVLVLATLLVLVFSGRPWRGYNMPRIAEIAVLPDDSRTEAVRRYTEIGSGIFPWLDGPRPELAGERQPLRLGYAYVEYGILGMPYGVGDEFGLVTYFDSPAGIQFGVIAPGQRPLLDEMVGRPLTRDYEFRWYLYVWGWLFPVLFLLWIYLWWREDRQEEQKLLEAGFEA